jgi:hypothetical protein
MEVFQMTEEREYQVAAARAEALATIERLNGLRPRDTSFDEPREWQRREREPEPESEPDKSEQLATAPVDWWKEIDQRIDQRINAAILATWKEIDRRINAAILHEHEHLCEGIGESFTENLTEMTAEFNGKLNALRAEVRELKAEAVRTFGNRLDSALAKATELCDRLERREPSGQVTIDLPPLPRRPGRDVN